MRLLDFLRAIESAAAITLPSLLPESAMFVGPLVVHSIALAEHALDAKTRMPLDGPTKLQLASEGVSIGVDAFNGHIKAKGGTPADVDMDDVQRAISAVVDVANALVTAGASINSRMVQSAAVELSPSLDALAASRSAVVQARPALL